jgi:chromosome segregation ATPase
VSDEAALNLVVLALSTNPEAIKGLVKERAAMVAKLAKLEAERDQLRAKLAVLSDLADVRRNAIVEQQKSIEWLNDQLQTALKPTSEEITRLRAQVQQLNDTLWKAKQWAALLYHHESDGAETTRERVAKLWDAIIQVQVTHPAANTKGST